MCVFLRVCVCVYLPVTLWNVLAQGSLRAGRHKSHPSPFH